MNKDWIKRTVARRPKLGHYDTWTELIENYTDYVFESLRELFETKQVLSPISSTFVGLHPDLRVLILQTEVPEHAELWRQPKMTGTILEFDGHATATPASLFYHHLVDSAGTYLCTRKADHYDTVVWENCPTEISASPDASRDLSGMNQIRIVPFTADEIAAAFESAAFRNHVRGWIECVLITTPRRQILQALTYRGLKDLEQYAPVEFPAMCGSQGQYMELHIQKAQELLRRKLGRNPCR